MQQLGTLKPSIENLWSHQNDVPLPQLLNNRYQCPLCVINYAYRKQAIKHIERCHSADDSLPKKLPECVRLPAQNPSVESKLKNLPALKKPVKWENMTVLSLKPASGVWHCPECPKSKDLRWQLMEHIWYAHYGGEFRCSACTSGPFTSSIGVKKHIRSVHGVKR